MHLVIVKTYLTAREVKMIPLFGMDGAVNLFHATMIDQRRTNKQSFEFERALSAESKQKLSCVRKRKRKTKTCSNAQDQDVWNQTPDRVTLPPQPGRVGHGQVACAASRRTDTHGQTRTRQANTFLSFFYLIFPPPLSLFPLAATTRRRGHTRTSARTPTLPPPRLAGDGWLRQLGRHRLEPNRGTPASPPSAAAAASARSLPRNPRRLSSRPFRVRVCAPLYASRSCGWGSEFCSIGGW